MITQELIGRRSKPMRVKIEKDAVRQFAEAVGIPFDKRVPPTFLITLREKHIEGLPKAGLIHGTQKFVYHQPIAIGDCITYTRSIKDIYEREGKLGRVAFIVLETEGLNPAGEIVFTSTSILIAPQQGRDKACY